MIKALLYGLATALPLVIGAGIGLRWRIPRPVLAALMAFGAGTMIAAASTELFEPAFHTVAAWHAGVALMAITVERTINASPDRIFALIADAARHAEIDGSGTVKGTRQDSRPLSLGSTFGMAMHLGVGYRTSNEVVEFEQDRRIAWQTTGLKGLIGGRIWRYELEPADQGTLVRETWDVSRDRQRFLLKRSRLAPAAKVGMRQTLERIATTLED